jgi:signal transduction histidine kinase
VLPTPIPHGSVDLGIVNRDGDVESAEARGARRAFAAVSHDLASPLTALQTYLKRGDVERAQQCVERIRAINDLARELSMLDEAGGAASTDLVLAVESAASRLSIAVDIAADGPQRARIAPARASTMMTALMRGVVAAASGTRFVARVEHRGDRICARIDPGIEPTAWRVIEPWLASTSVKLDLWAGAVAAGADAVVRVGHVDGQIAVELDLPAVEPR